MRRENGDNADRGPGRASTSDQRWSYQCFHTRLDRQKHFKIPKSKIQISCFVFVPLCSSGHKAAQVEAEIRRLIAKPRYPEGSFNLSQPWNFEPKSHVSSPICCLIMSENCTGRYAEPLLSNDVLIPPKKALPSLTSVVSIARQAFKSAHTKSSVNFVTRSACTRVRIMQYQGVVFVGKGTQRSSCGLSRYAQSFGIKSIAISHDCQSFLASLLLSTAFLSAPIDHAAQQLPRSPTFEALHRTSMNRSAAPVSEQKQAN